MNLAEWEARQRHDRYYSRPQPERNAAIVRDYASGMLFREVGKKYNLTLERCRQIYLNAVRRERLNPHNEVIAKAFVFYDTPREMSEKLGIDFTLAKLVLQGWNERIRRWRWQREEEIEARKLPVVIQGADQWVKRKDGWVISTMPDTQVDYELRREKAGVD